MIHQEELLFDILSRVPTKSVGRFRCVSKPWKSLLTQPEFIKTHHKRILDLKNEQESLIILVSRDSGSLYSAQIKNADHQANEITVSSTQLTLGDHRFDSSSIRMASCEGLILVRDKEEELLLINPTTREFKVLPNSPYALNLLNWGIGYDSSTDDYKVVTISGNDEMRVNIYSVRNGTWKRVKNSPFDHADFQDTCVVYVDGYMNIHWVATNYMNPDDEATPLIAAFNIEEEKFYEIPSLEESELDCNYKASYEESDYRFCKFSGEFVLDNMVAIGGCLCVYPKYISESCSAMFVVMMEEHCVEESWTKITFNDESDSLYRPICLLEEEQMVLVMDDNKLVMYHLEEETFTESLVLEGPSLRALCRLIVVTNLCENVN